MEVGAPLAFLASLASPWVGASLEEALEQGLHSVSQEVATLKMEGLGVHQEVRLQVHLHRGHRPQGLMDVQEASQGPVVEHLVVAEVEGVPEEPY